MKNRKRLVRGVALFLAGLMLFSLVFAALGSIFASAADRGRLNQLQSQKAELRSQKAAAGNAAGKLREERASYEEQKAALDEKNRIAQEEINNTREQIEIYNEMIEEKRQEAEAAQAAADEQLELYKKHLRAMEENGTYNFYLSVIFGAEDFGDLISRIDMISEIMESDKQVEQEYKDSRDVALEAKAEYEAVHEELEAKKAELEEESAQFERDIQEAVNLINELNLDINEYNRIYNDAAASEAAVQKEIDKIMAQIKAEEEAARKEQERLEQERLEQQQQQNNGGGNNNPPPSTNVTPPGGGTATGSFIWPVGTRLITSPFGNRVHPLTGATKFHAGVDIGAGAGAPIQAADGGTVINAEDSGNGYGKYVVINHGNGKSTLYAHMSSIAVSKGAVVSKGQVIGYVGSSGNTTGPHLHFEVKVNGGLVDPLSYFGGPGNFTFWNG